MDQKYLSQTFIRERVPPWKCPSCSEGRLKLEGDFTIRDDANTQRHWDEEWFGQEYSHYVFTGMLRCANCNEAVVVAGDGGVEEDYDVTGIDYYSVLTPRFFYPPLKIIEPNVSAGVLPENVTSYLEKAFQVFWCDADSCMNRLRTVIEHVLDGLSIPRTGPKSKRLNLATRISMITDPKYVSVKDALDSIRHMGNDGTHGSVGIERHELLSAFAVVKFCLEQIYTDNTALLAFVSDINKKKGFR